MKELRCKKCNKLLGKYYNDYHIETNEPTVDCVDKIKGKSYTEIKCHRCKINNKF